MIKLIGFIKNYKLKFNFKYINCTLKKKNKNLIKFLLINKIHFYKIFKKNLNLLILILNKNYYVNIINFNFYPVKNIIKNINFEENEN